MASDPTRKRNSDDLRRMLETYYDKVDESTRARACIFDISQSTSPSDLFLVIKLEKVLQGDINDAAEPYLKDMVSFLLSTFYYIKNYQAETGSARFI